MSLHLVGALDESIHKSAGDVIENRTNHLLQQPIGKLVVKREFNLATCVAELGKAPLSIKLLEWSISQTHLHRVWRLFIIARREMSLHAVIVDVQGRYGRCCRSFQNLRATAPRQELRIGFNVLNQIEQFACRTLDQYNFLDVSHAGTGFGPRRC